VAGWTCKVEDIVVDLVVNVHFFEVVESNCSVDVPVDVYISQQVVTPVVAIV
jgi:hypothetical protein